MLSSCKICTEKTICGLFVDWLVASFGSNLNNSTLLNTIVINSCKRNDLVNDNLMCFTLLKINHYSRSRFVAENM